jgi:hypothetical protein
MYLEREGEGKPRHLLHREGARREAGRRLRVVDQGRRRPIEVSRRNTAPGHFLNFFR